MGGAPHTADEEVAVLLDRLLVGAVVVVDGAIGVGPADHLEGDVAGLEDPIMNLPMHARTRCPCSRKRPPG